ncbi:MAG: T9SS type A sorting domain-containing protein [Bacteroidota bacterium]|nr:T9SS type A sorting domain-containing protein [Bacteroidota bacterium]
MQKSRVFLSIVFCLVISCGVYAQQTIRASINHGGLKRTFSFYVPAIYAKGKPTPLVFNLHGYGSTGDQQEFYGDFRKIADTAGFIVVHPNGTLYPQGGQSFWNVGLVGSSNVDDVGFVHAIIDSLSKSYTIDQARVYSTGMSNGGFMSYHLACVSDRFAAIASVTGSMTTLTLSKCTNAKPFPIMEIHGDADAVVNYNGSAGVLSIPAVLDYWVKKNGLNPQDLVQTQVPNINTTDGARAELLVYPGVNEVQHYKVLNGGHTWPGAAFVIGTTCMDFSASDVIWKFFSKYKKSLVSTNDLSVAEISFYPNPAFHSIKIIQQDFANDLKDVQCLNQFGVTVKNFHIESPETTIDFSDLPAGLYFLQSQSTDKIYRAKLIKL